MIPTGVTWDRGISLLGHDLWLDPLVVRDVAAISHAHTDHTRRHRMALLTHQTLALLPDRRRPRGWQPVAYGEPRQVGRLTLTFLDAGHMLGSAMVLAEGDGVRVLYTGDMKLRQGWGRPDTPIPACDVLIVESTYGRPHFRFPDPDSTVEAVARWCRRALDSRITPVLLGHALGKSQEVMLALAPYGFEFALEERCIESTMAYERAGVAMPPWRPLAAGDPAGRVVLCPPAGKDEIRGLGRYRTAFVSGWALEPTFWRMFGADVAFPFSDHCDFDELGETVERSGAKQVYTVHGFTEELARSLRRRGHRAHALAASEQLALAI